MKTTLLPQISWELSVLARAVAYSNLSAASQQIGISQPQLSRIVAKLEKTLGVVLLSREVRRRATWMPLAIELAQTYGRGTRHLEAEMKRVIEDSPIKQLRLGTLEGLLSTASELAQQMIARLKLETLELNVYDLSELEALFLRGELDLVLTMREPGRRKYTFSKVVGYQVLEELQSSENSGSIRIQSGYEFQSESQSASRRRRDASAPTLISNSLAVRRHWLEKFGGSGLFPSPLNSRKSGAKSENPVLLLGAESLGAKVWKLI